MDEQKSEHFEQNSEQPGVGVMATVRTLAAREMAAGWIDQNARSAGGKQKAQRAYARRLSVTVWTVRNLIRGDRKAVSADEYARILELDIERREAARARDDDATNFDRQAARMEAIDPDFYRAEIDRHRAIARRIRALAD